MGPPLGSLTYGVQTIKIPVSECAMSKVSRCKQDKNFRFRIQLVSLRGHIMGDNQNASKSPHAGLPA